MKILGEIERNGDVVHPRIMKALRVVDFYHKLYASNDQEAEIVHVMDGKHHKGSRHYVGLAADIRIWYIPAGRLKEFVEFIQKQLGMDYDVILEKDHIHLEFDPKYPSL